MNRDDAEEFTQSLGLIVGGSWRQIRLAEKLGVPKALGLKTDDWVRQRLGGYVKLSTSDRREAALELKAEGASNVEIGRTLGVDEKTVRNDTSEKSDIPVFESTEMARDGAATSENSEAKTEERRASNEQHVAAIKARPTVRAAAMISLST